MLNTDLSINCGSSCSIFHPSLGTSIIRSVHQFIHQLWFILFHFPSFFGDFHHQIRPSIGPHLYPIFILIPIQLSSSPSNSHPQNRLIFGELHTACSPSFISETREVLSIILGTFKLKYNYFSVYIHITTFQTQ